MRIILLGPPGSGKGTQSTYISKCFNITHLSTGDILRSEVNSSTDLGIIAKTYMDKGDLIPDDLMIRAIKNQIIDLSSGFLLDGFPRTLAQAKSLDLLLEQIEKPLDKVICLNVSKEEVLNRLSFRAICNKCSHNYNLATRNISNNLEISPNYAYFKGKIRYFYQGFYFEYDFFTV